MSEGQSPPQGELPSPSHYNLYSDLCPADVKLHSPGIWEASDFLHYALPRLQLQLAVIFILTQSLHFLLKRLHLPRIASEILAGIILGPTFLGHIPNFTKTLFPPDSDIFIDVLSKIGYIFFIFLSGVKMDPRLGLTAGAGTISAWYLGAGAPILTFIGGMSVSRLFEKWKLHTYRWPAVKSIVSVHNLFAFPVIASVLVDLKIMNSELGRLALSSTLIADLVSNVLSTIGSNVRIGYAGWMNGVGAISLILAIVAIGLVLLVNPISRWVIKQTPEGKPVNKVYVILMCVGVLLSAVLTDNIGLVYQYGPFMVGLALPDGPPLGSTLVQKLETLTSGLFAPLLVTYCGMKVNLIELYDLGFIRIVWGVISLCLVLKFMVIVVLASLFSRVPFKDVFALAFILSTQGVVQMSFYFNSSISQTFDGETFSMVTSSVLLIAAGTQLCAKSLYDVSRIYTGYQKRDIQHISHNSELRILACAHRVEDVLAIKRMLEASLPGKEIPLAVYALNLVELAGRAHPLLIDHQLGQRSSQLGSSHSYKTIEVFHSFGQQCSGMISVQLFTAMSLPRFMHHDVCSLAFDKLTSLIILPFHRKWNYQGKMILDSSSVRATNINVFDMAPCSVGILVDRHRIRRSAAPSSTYNVAVVFIGGSDDREALAYGKRMARSPGVHLTVVRFIAFDAATENQWDAVIDAEILKDTRLQGTHQDNIVYKEEKVRDGAETALHINTLEESFDLIVVGRRHREESPQLLGLNEWNDLPELGPIGDMLASSEINKPVSVLVIQQQIVRTK